MKHKFGQQVAWSVLFNIARPFMRPITGYTYKRAKTIHGPAIIMCNHNMDIDIGLLGLSYRQCMQPVASEHIFRLGILTKMINLFFAPIVRLKGKTEVRTVREILKIIKRGGRVCIFPEGNRSFNGLTGEITRASASLARMAKCQLITYRIEGGYLKHPRWAKTVRRGRISGREIGRYSADTLAAMSTDEVLELIQQDLWEDAYARQQETAFVYKGKNLAESIERALYLCPKCGKISSIQSKGDHLFCSCGLAMRYTKTGLLESANAEKPYFSTVTAWDLWQQSMTEKLTERAGEGNVTEDVEISLYAVEPCKSKKLIETGILSISQNELICGSTVFSLDAISDLAIVGPNTLVFETQSGSYFEMRSKSDYSALKYRRIFLHCRTIAKGERSAEEGTAQQ